MKGTELPTSVKSPVRVTVRGILSETLPEGESSHSTQTDLLSFIDFQGQGTYAAETTLSSFPNLHLG